MAMSTSSADPGQLGQYVSTSGMANHLLAEGRERLVRAVGDFSAGQSFGPPVPDPAAALAGMLADARHLEAFVRRVGEAFAAADAGRGTVTLDDATLSAGGVGFATPAASRHGARAVLEVLIDAPWWGMTRADQLGALDPGQVDAVLGQIARGRFDPTFAVTLLHELGTEGLMELMTILRYRAQRRGAGDGATAASRAQVSTLADLLTTGFGTRSGATGGDRLSDRWVESFHTLDLPTAQARPTVGPPAVEPTLVDFSLLVRLAQLPGPDLRRIANHYVSVAHPEPWTAQRDPNPFGEAYGNIEANLLLALAADTDASYQWLQDPNPAGRNWEALVFDRPGVIATEVQDQAEQAVLRAGLTNPRAGRLPSGEPAVAVDEGTFLGTVEGSVGRRDRAARPVTGAASRTLADVAVHWSPGYAVRITPSTVGQSSQPTTSLDEQRARFMEAIMGDDEAAARAMAGVTVEVVGLIDRPDVSLTADRDAAGLLALFTAANHNAVRADLEREQARLDEVEKLLQGTLTVGKAAGGGPAAAGSAGLGLLASEVLHRLVQAGAPTGVSAGPDSGPLSSSVVTRAYGDGLLGTAEENLARACAERQRRSREGPVDTVGCDPADDFFAAPVPGSTVRPISPRMTARQQAAYRQWVLDQGNSAPEPGADPRLSLETRINTVNGTYRDRFVALTGR